MLLVAVIRRALMQAPELRSENDADQSPLLSAVILRRERSTNGPIQVSSKSSPAKGGAMDRMINTSVGRVHIALTMSAVGADVKLLDATWPGSGLLFGSGCVYLEVLSKIGISVFGVRCGYAPVYITSYRLISLLSTIR